MMRDTWSSHASPSQQAAYLRVQWNHPEQSVPSWPAPWPLTHKQSQSKSAEPGTNQENCPELPAKQMAVVLNHKFWGKFIYLLIHLLDSYNAFHLVLSNPHSTTQPEWSLKLHMYGWIYIIYIICMHIICIDIFLFVWWTHSMVCDKCLTTISRAGIC